MDNNQEVIEPPKETKKAAKKDKKSVNKKKVVGITALIVGLATLVAGVVFLLIGKSDVAKVQDAEFLVQVGTWQREDEPTVVWNFTEVGKGTLTTNFHIDDYDFVWALDGDKLKIETAWLYDLNDSYTYKLDQNDEKLILNDKIVFVPVITQSDEE